MPAHISSLNIADKALPLGTLLAKLEAAGDVCVCLTHHKIERKDNTWEIRQTMPVVFCPREKKDWRAAW